MGRVVEVLNTVFRGGDVEEVEVVEVVERTAVVDKDVVVVETLVVVLLLMVELVEELVEEVVEELVEDFSLVVNSSGTLGQVEIGPIPMLEFSRSNTTWNARINDAPRIRLVLPSRNEKQ